jgi:hypothetical protein
LPGVRELMSWSALGLSAAHIGGAMVQHKMKPSATPAETVNDARIR